MDTFLTEHIKIFKETVKKINKNDVWIIGGTVRDNELQNFLNVIKYDIEPYVIIDRNSTIEFIRTTIMDLSVKLFTHDNDSLQEEPLRIRIFNESGDFELKRKDEYYSWRYIGNESIIKSLIIEKNQFTYYNYWDSRENEYLNESTEFVYLIGIYNTENKTWTSNKYAGARLNYPIDFIIDENGSRIKVRCILYSNRGQIYFTRLVDLIKEKTQ